jgi:hypothetical protein
MRPHRANAPGVEQGPEAPIVARDEPTAMRLKRSKRGITFDGSRAGANESKTANSRHNVHRLPKCQQWPEKSRLPTLK